MDTLGKRLKHFRLSLGLTQDELAASTNSTKQNISRYEADLAFPGGEFIRDFFIGLNGNPVWLLSGQGNVYYVESQTQKAEQMHRIRELEAIITRSKEQLKMLIESMDISKDAPKFEQKKQGADVLGVIGRKRKKSAAH